VLGATGLVGETLIKVLEERDFPVGELFPLASSRSLGKGVEFRGRDIPLVVPEVNPEAIALYTKRRIIANANCSTIQMLVALKPLHDAAGIERINVATYQSVSGAGKEAVEELAAQAVALMSGKGSIKAKAIAPRSRSMSCPESTNSSIMAIDNGSITGEMKMMWETQKILGDPSIRVNATAVRVPVFFGHSEAVHIDTRKPGGYPTAIDAAGHDEVFVGRIREDLSHERGLDLWIVADNIRKGAATNSVQIAELLVREHL
jgi:aspartate-semialdehyde dehydrogenase